MRSHRTYCCITCLFTWHMSWVSFHLSKYRPTASILDGCIVLHRKDTAFTPYPWASGLFPIRRNSFKKNKSFKITPEQQVSFFALSSPLYGMTYFYMVDIIASTPFIFCKAYYKHFPVLFYGLHPVFSSSRVCTSHILCLLACFNNLSECFKKIFFLACWPYKNRFLAELCP